MDFTLSVQSFAVQLPQTHENLGEKLFMTFIYMEWVQNRKLRCTDCLKEKRKKHHSKSLFKNPQQTKNQPMIAFHTL